VGSKQNSKGGTKKAGGYGGGPDKIVMKYVSGGGLGKKSNGGKSGERKV